MARSAGVSKTAVSQVFAGTGRISPATAERVLAAAAELGYAPDHAARSLRSRRTRMLTMIIPQVENPYYLEIFAGAQAAAAERGYAIGLFAAADAAAARERLRWLASGVADAVVVTGDAGIDELAEDLRRLREQGVAVAVTHASGPGAQIPSVRVDVERGAHLAVDHLVALGHRRIAYVGNTVDAAARAGDPNHPGDGRWRGYRRALGRAGIDYDETLVYAAEPTAAGGAACAAALAARLGARRAPSAVFAFNDLVGMGVLYGLASAGVSVPADVSVVGFDGVGLGEFTVPALTTIAHPREELGRRAVTLVCDQLDVHPAARSEEAVLSPTLVVRASTAPATAR